VTYTVHTVESASAAASESVATVVKAYGFLPNLLAVMAEAPALLMAYQALGKLFEATSFDKTERQVVLLATSYENGCEYCVAAHTALAGMQKVPNDVVAAIREGRPLADRKLEALRRFTAAIVTSRGRPSDVDTEAFRAVGYGNQQVLEVLLGVGMKTLSNYTNYLVDTPLDRAFAKVAWAKAA
jgi:AhpD family alkylhydroperoxidase